VDRNLLLAIVLSGLVLALWSSWQQQEMERFEARDETPTLTDSLDSAGEFSFPAPVDGDDAYPELPVTEAVTSAPAAASQSLPRPQGERFVSQQPLYAVEFSTVGAAIESWALQDYKDRDGAYVMLVAADQGFGAAAETPFLELEAGNLARERWVLDAREEHELSFSIQRGDLRITKKFVMNTDSYIIDLTLAVENQGDSPVSPRFALGWPAHVRPGSDFTEQSLAVLEGGELETEMLAGIGTAGFFGGSAQKQYSFPGHTDWVGVQSNYFLAALLPDAPSLASARFLVRRPGESAVAEAFFSPVELGKGQRAERVYRIYAGPKLPARLESLGAGTLRSIDLGWSWVAPLTRFFNWLLEVLYGFIGNYGVAIIVLTILVRVVTAPLTVKQMRSMERMRHLQPLIKELQAKYADDRQKQSEEMMRLYKREKVNPLGGCFPIVLQMPVFIGLFYALRSSIQLRQAPFFGWINDLAAPDTLFVLPGIDIPVRVLPLVMGASMVVQQRITPMQMDPDQARMMMIIMPLMMTVLFYQFASGLVLYWLMSNVLAISHQLWIGRNLKPTQASVQEA